MVGFDVEVFVGVRNDLFYVGLNISCEHHSQLKDKYSILSKRNRTELGITTLNNAVAYGMCTLVEALPGQMIVDPMAGVGTIPIEGSLLCPNTLWIAGDLWGDDVIKMTRNIQDHAKYGNVIHVHWDAQCVPLKNESVDGIVCDLPFGHKHGNFKLNAKLYPKMMKEFARITKIGAKVVLLTMEKGILRRIISESPVWKVASTYTADVGGFEADLVVLTKVDSYCSFLAHLASAPPIVILNKKEKEKLARIQKRLQQQQVQQQQQQGQQEKQEQQEKQ